MPLFEIAMRMASSVSSKQGTALQFAGRPLRRGDAVRVWHGPGFIRTGRIIDTDPQNREILVEYDYDIPNEWVRVSKLC